MFFVIEVETAEGNWQRYTRTVLGRQAAFVYRSPLNAESIARERFAGQSWRVIELTK